MGGNNKETSVINLQAARFGILSSGHRPSERLRGLTLEVNAQAVVQVNNVTKSYKGGIKALDGISLEVSEGEIFGLIGPNGAGKTTLIGCILGLLKPDSGSVSVCGKGADFLSVRRITGYVPERPDFEYWMTARQFLEYHHGLAGLQPNEAPADIQAALELVELQPSAWNRRLKTYSRGMLQRLNLAQLVIAKPRLMLLDEPTLGLDPTGVTVVRNIIDNALASGATAIINSHQLDEIERLCDRVAFIRQGKIGSIETIKAGEICQYVLYVKWNQNQLPGEIGGCIRAACASTGAILMEQKERWGRFRVQDNKAAAELIRILISSGLPVEEAIPERMRLEQLFSTRESADSGGTQ